MASVLWFRRDLRLHDNPAALAAVEAAQSGGDGLSASDGRTVPVFVVDPRLWDRAGAVRQAYLADSLRSLDESLSGRLLVLHGDPASVIPDLARSVTAASVHVAADFAPYGMQRDADVEQALGPIPLIRTGSPYAVAPGRVVKDDGSAYRVFTPFYKAWLRHGWRSPAPDLAHDVDWWRPIEGDGLPQRPDLGDLRLPAAGEAAAWERWERFRQGALAQYKDNRDRPDLDGTSALSHHLRWGELHPRSLLAELADDPGAETFRKELCWREFYADVLAQFPGSARDSLDARYDERMRWAQDAAATRMFDLWASGTTGYPFVDAGMRQLRAEGWVHNRVRMVVASFLVKDLHLPWQLGAREFMRWLRDGDLASNSHGWQWTAGCGTDAAPFYRIFNPVLQGLKFDPDGDYVRRYLPELRHIAGKAVHEPWNNPQGYAHGYPERIVDHHAERDIALADYAELKA